MFAPNLLLLALSVGSSVAAPADFSTSKDRVLEPRVVDGIVELEPRLLNCAVVKTVLNVFTKHTASASAFCSSYLQTSTTVTVSTAARVTAPVTITPPPIVETITVTEPFTVTETGPAFVTAENTYRKRDVSPPAPTNNIVKRTPTVKYPNWLPANMLPALVSAGCSCYVVPPPKQTITSVKVTGTETTYVTITLPPEQQQVVVTETSTTTATVANPNSTPIFCGVPGCGDGSVQGVLITRSGPGSVADCKASCAAKSNCVLYQHSAAGCNEWSAPLDVVYADGTSTLVGCSNANFYDVRCEV